MYKRSLLFASLLSLISCTKDSKLDQKPIEPVEFSSEVGIKGFNYPEDKNVIYSWIDSQDDESMIKHSWGVWAGLTKETDQLYGKDKLKVFETWLGVKELSDAVSKMDKDFGCSSTKKSRAFLNTPKQFIHAGLADTQVTSDYSILETVSYSPSAACYASQNLIFNKSTLDSFAVKGEIGKIPDFPDAGITTKPTYYVSKAKSGLIRVPAWDTTPDPAKAFSHKVWQNYIFVDLTNSQFQNKTLVPVKTETPTQEEIDAATCNLSDFIYHKIDKSAADYLNEHQDQGTDPDHQFHDGDIALLVAMHVSTREVTNWTWQTYFWVPNPSNPGEPSSPTIAYLKPEQITGAPAHYALSYAYSMTTPEEPVIGNFQNIKPVIAYNPYLEAGFGPKVFSHANTWKPDFQFGVQTNCISCHALATSSGKLGYSTDQYIDLQDPMFNDDVQLDFAWSIQGNINQDK